MGFVPVKSKEVQAILILHRVRDLLAAARIALPNQIGNLLEEFGIGIMPRHGEAVTGDKRLNADAPSLFR